jgi:photosynthetic reaction center H subunit
VLLPVNFARIGTRGVVVDSVMGSDFAGVPPTRDPDQVTLLEEERVMAYYGAGTLYASPRRSEPLL